MTIDRWLAASAADARRRSLDDLVPLLEGLAAALTALRNADFNDNASGSAGGAGRQPSGRPGGSATS